MLSRGGPCVTNVTAGWECNLGNNHGPGEGDSCTSWTYTITVHWGPCDNIIDVGGSSTGGGISVDAENGDPSSGGSGGGGDDDQESNPPGDDEECILDSKGNCIVDETTPFPPKETPEEKPCPGDPVPNPEIAPQLGPSGTSGGLHNTCSRSGSGCTGNTSRKAHNGVDIENPYGAPIYAMYDGTATFATQFKRGTTKIIGSGHQVSITSTINGETVRLVYFHLQESNRINGTVHAGDIIGYQGISGNLGVAIEKAIQLLMSI